MLKRLTTAEESEWFGRVTIQLFSLSGTAFNNPGELDEFKQLQMSLAESLRECRDIQLEITALIDKHLEEVASGMGVYAENGNIRVEDDIEPKLNRLFNDFFSKARTVLYHLFGQQKAPQSVTHFLLGRSISFAQQKEDASFERSAAKFLADVPGEKAQTLMDSLRGDRAAWMLKLIGTRDRMIHDITCPQLKMRYHLGVGGKVLPLFPTVDHEDLRRYLNLFWENLFQAVEQTVILCITIRLPDYLAPCRIAEDKIDPSLRFPWRLALRPVSTEDA